jgi:RNA recognition motif-containing protein
MSKKLFVGGLAWGTTDEGLRQAFDQYGDVSEAIVIMDRDTGRSRGFGFVTFEKDDEAMEAMSRADGMTLDGRNIKVNEANERPPRSNNRNNNRGGGARW